VPYVAAGRREDRDSRDRYRRAGAVAVRNPGGPHDADGPRGWGTNAGGVPGPFLEEAGFEVEERIPLAAPYSILLATAV